MKLVYEAINKCDNIIIMSPIYINHITGILKNVFDRFNPYCSSERLKNKKIFLITVGQMSEEEQKERFKKHLNDNEKIFQEELRKKYNPNDLFKKNEINENILNRTKKICKLLNIKNENGIKKYLKDY